MKKMVFGVGLLIAGTIGLAGMFIASMYNPMLIVYGLLSVIGLIIGILSYSENSK